MSQPTVHSQSVQKIVLFVCFFLSGFSGLLYQVVWLRLAFASFGIVTPVLSVVVSVFMMGIALGAVLSGKIAIYASKVSRLPALQLYSICELSIGLLAICVPSLFHEMRSLLLSAGDVDSFSYTGLSALAISVTLLPCCILMGFTYPLMMAHMRQTFPEVEKDFGFLYWANVSGAALGAIASAYVLIELLGFRQCLLFGCALNVIAAFASLILSRNSQVENLTESCDKIAESESHIKTPISIIGLLFLTGFVSLALEVVWSRIFMPIFGTGIYAFAIVLFTYLQATAFGSRRYLAKKKDNAPLRLEPILAALSVCILLPVLVNGFPPLVSYASLGDSERQIRCLVAILGIMPFCFFLGYLTPMLIDRGSRGLPGAAGRLYAINSLGCIIGPLVASYLLLPLLGARISQLLLALPFVIIVFWLAARQKSKLMITASVISIGILLVASLVCGSYEEPRWPEAKVYRDYSSTVVAAGQGRDSKLLVNGQEMTARVPFLKMMAHFPIVLHDGPVKSSLTICLGMGTTFRSLLSWQHDTHAVELANGVKSASLYFHPDLHDQMDKIIVDDGRRYLECSKQKFDIITIDPPLPLEATGSGLLYSREFCQVLKAHLNPGGLLQQFFPTDEKPVLSAVYRALKENFHYVRIFHSSEGWGYHFIASDTPIIIPSLKEIEKRLPPRVIADLLENEEGRDRGKPLNQFKRMIYFEVPLQEIVDSNPNNIITDDRALNEYCLVRRLLSADNEHLKTRKMMTMPEELDK